MAGDITLGITLTADGSDLVGAVRISRGELDKLEAGLEDTAKAADKANKKADRFAAGLRAAGKAIAVGAAAFTAAAVGLTMLATNAIASADAVGKQADKVGIGVEALQEYRYAAELSGVAQDTLDMAVQRFSRRLGEARQGMGELLPVLEQYGIALVDAEGNTRSLDDVLGDYADAVARAGDSSEQLRLAFKGFDSEGAALVNMLRQGSQGLERMRQQARNLGIVLDEGMVRQAEDANDALTRMERIAGVNLQRVLLSLAPLIEQVATAFGEAAPKIAEMADNLIELFFGVEALGLSGLRREFEEVTRKIEELHATRKKVSEMTDAELQQYKQEVLLLGQRAVKLDALLKKKEEQIKLDKELLQLNSGTGAPSSQADQAAAEARAKAEAEAQAYIAGLEETYLQVTGREAELIDLRREQALAKLAELHDAKLISEMEYLEAEGAVTMTALKQKEDLQAQHQETLEQQVAEHLARMNAQEAYAAELNKQIWESGWKGKAQIMQGVMGQISVLMESGSRKMFEVGKAAAIGETVIQTIRAAQGAYAAYASIPYIGPVLGAAAAAAATLAGMARVQQIKSQQFGGSGSASGAGAGAGAPSLGGGSAPAPSVSAPPVRADAAPQPTQNVYLTLQGEGAPSDEYLRDVFIPGLRDAMGDNVNFQLQLAS